VVPTAVINVLFFMVDVIDVVAIVSLAAKLDVSGKLEFAVAEV